MQLVFRITTVQAIVSPCPSVYYTPRPLAESLSQIHQPFYQFVPAADDHPWDPQELSNVHQASTVLRAGQKTQLNLATQHSQFYIKSAQR